MVKINICSLNSSLYFDKLNSRWQDSVNQYKNTELIKMSDLIKILLNHEYFSGLFCWEWFFCDFFFYGGPQENQFKKCHMGENLYRISNNLKRQKFTLLIIHTLEEKV